MLEESELTAYKLNNPLLIATFEISLYEIPSITFLHSPTIGQFEDPLIKFNFEFLASLPDLPN